MVSINNYKYPASFYFISITILFFLINLNRSLFIFPYNEIVLGIYDHNFLIIFLTQIFLIFCIIVSINLVIKYNTNYKKYYIFIIGISFILIIHMFPLIYGSTIYDHDTYRNIMRSYLLYDLDISDIRSIEMKGSYYYVSFYPISFILNFYLLKIFSINEIYIFYKINNFVFMNLFIYSLNLTYNYKKIDLEKYLSQLLLATIIWPTLNIFGHPSPQLTGFYFFTIILYLLTKKNQNKLSLLYIFIFIIIFFTHITTFYISIFTFTYFRLLTPMTIKKFSLLKIFSTLNIKRLFNFKLKYFVIFITTILLSIYIVLIDFFIYYGNRVEVNFISSILYLIPRQPIYYLTIFVFLLFNFLIFINCLINIINDHHKYEYLFNILHSLIPFILISSGLFIISFIFLDGAFGGRWLLFGFIPFTMFITEKIHEIIISYNTKKSISILIIFILVLSLSNMSHYHFSYIHGVSNDEIEIYDYISQNYDTNFTNIYYFFAHTSDNYNILIQSSDDRMSKYHPYDLDELFISEINSSYFTNYSHLLILSPQALSLLRQNLQNQTLEWEYIQSKWVGINLELIWKNSNHYYIYELNIT